MGTARKIDRLGPFADYADEDDVTTAIVRRPVVLIVDDDAVVRAAMTRVVTLCSMRALEAESGIQAIEILARRRVDVVVCDQSMPTMTGSDVLDIVAERFPQVGRVLLSGHSLADLVSSNVNLGGVHMLLHKGAPSPEFQAALWELVKGKRRAD